MIPRKITSFAQDKYNKITGDLTDVLGSELNKAWRAKILLDRKRRPVSQKSVQDEPTNTDLAAKVNTGGHLNPVESSKTLDVYKTITLSKQQTKSVKWNEKKSRYKELEDPYWDPHITWDGTKPLSLRSDARSIEKRPEKPKIIIYNFLASPAQRVILQTIPKEIDFQGENTWGVIKSMGRNTPMYHYTGSESIIQFNITWYCNDPSNPSEVVTNCRLLEAWSKTDGYFRSPPLLKIQWGTSGLFDNQLFILSSATYKLSNWRAGIKTIQRDKDLKRELYTPVGYVEPGLNPSVATQELIFKRVSANNLTYNEIIGSNKPKTKNIVYDEPTKS